MRVLAVALLRTSLGLAVVGLGGADAAFAQGRQMEGGWCGAHGSFTSGYDCPGCASGNSSGGGGGYTGPSFEELEAQRRAYEAALARAKEEAERARLKKEIADLDAALKVAREAAKRVRADEAASRRARDERRRAIALADEVLRGVFGDPRGPEAPGLEPRFSRGTRDSAPVESRSKGVLAGEARPLEFLGVPGGRGPRPSSAGPDRPELDRPARLAAIHALAAELGWSSEERARLKAAGEALALDGVDATEDQIRAAWAGVHDPARDALAARLGPAPVAAGTQSHQDCTIFALANAAGVPYGVVAARAGELLRQGAWRSSADRADPQRVIEREGLNGDEVIVLAEALGQAEVVKSADFVATLAGGRPLLVCVVPPSGDVGAGHQVVLTRTFQHEGGTWFEMVDSNQGPTRRLYVKMDELQTMLIENGVAYRPEPDETPRAPGGGLDFQRPR